MNRTWRGALVLSPTTSVHWYPGPGVAEQRPPHKFR